MRTSSKIIGAGFAVALAFVAGWEGLALVDYTDIVGVPTACYGQTGEGVAVGTERTEDECFDMLDAELARYWVAVDRLVVVPMQPYHQAAFASFAYNVGISAFAKSTLLAKVNHYDYSGACAELLRWVYAGGKKIRGLVNRREAEYKLCMGEGA